MHVLLFYLFDWQCRLRRRQSTRASSIPIQSEATASAADYGLRPDLDGYAQTATSDGWGDCVRRTWVRADRLGATKLDYLLLLKGPRSRAYLRIRVLNTLSEPIQSEATASAADYGLRPDIIGSGNVAVRDQWGDGVRRTWVRAARLGATKLEYLLLLKGPLKGAYLRSRGLNGQ